MKRSYLLGHQPVTDGQMLQWDWRQKADGLHLGFSSLTQGERNQWSKGRHYNFFSQLVKNAAEGGPCLSVRSPRGCNDQSHHFTRFFTDLQVKIRSTDCFFSNLAHQVECSCVHVLKSPEKEFGKRWKVTGRSACHIQANQSDIFTASQTLAVRRCPMTCHDAPRCWSKSYSCHSRSGVKA